MSCFAGLYSITIVNVIFCLVLAVDIQISLSFVDMERVLYRLWLNFTMVVILYDLVSIVLWGLLYTCPKVRETMKHLMGIHMAIQNTTYYAILIAGAGLPIAYRQLNLREFGIYGLCFNYCIIQTYYMCYLTCKIDSEMKIRAKLKMSITCPEIKANAVNTRLLEEGKPQIVFGDCCICLEKIEDEEMIYDFPCKHYNHSKCLDGMTKPTCPMCRTVVGEIPASARALVDAGYTLVDDVDDSTWFDIQRRLNLPGDNILRTISTGPEQPMIRHPDGTMLNLPAPGQVLEFGNVRITGATTFSIHRGGTLSAQVRGGFMADFVNRALVEQEARQYLRSLSMPYLDPEVFQPPEFSHTHSE